MCWPPRAGNRRRQAGVENVELLIPENLDEALALLAEDHRPMTPIAGGTDLLVSWRQRATADLRLLDLSRCGEGLRDMRLSGECLEMGALATYWDVINSPLAAAEFPLLIEAARQVGSIQIQTRGTWAGNVANGSPAADGVLALLALDATVVLQSTRGRREVPLHGFWSGYKQSVRARDELIVAIRVPRRRYDLTWFHKVGSRSAQTITKVGVAMTRGDAGWRVAANSVAPFVTRCPTIEKALEAGRKFANPDELRANLAKDISPIDDVRSTAEYRARVLSRLIYYRLFTPQR